MHRPSNSSPKFSIGQARNIVRDLFEPRAKVYWADFLLSMTVGCFGFVVVRRGLLIEIICRAADWQGDWPRYSLTVAFFCLSCLGFYRAALFTHELVHLRQGAMRGFRTAWNLMCGIPFLMPSFIYETHVQHHMRKHYGTDDDGEYLYFASQPAWHIFLYLGQSFVLPVAYFVRFALLTPLTWISPRFRDFVHARASSMVVDPTWIRPLPTTQERRSWRWLEVGCLLYCWLIVGLIATRLLPPMWLPHAYLTSVCVLMLNSVRTIGAHRYRHEGQELTFEDQLLDSVNYPNNPLLSELWAPVGLRFHALHHVFPSLPYHNLAQAHRRLMAQLPADSPYRQTNSPSLWASLLQLWCAARTSSRRQQTEDRAIAA